MKQPFYALLDILPLTASTYALTAKAYKVDPRTIYLLLPYCAWLTYASYLNGKLRRGQRTEDLANERLIAHSAETAGFAWLNDWPKFLTQRGTKKL